ncbi:MAG: thioredoxin family protein [Flavobacteriales bacterium]
MTAQRFTSSLFAIVALASMPWSAMAQQASINWMSLEEAVAAQQDEPRKIMMDVYTQWCGPCKMMMRNTFTSADVISYINANYYAVKFDAESPEPVTYQDQTFENPGWSPNARGRNSTHQLSRALGVNAYPTLVYFDENATVITPIAGYKTPQQLELYLRFFAEEYTNGVQQEQWEKFRDAFAPSFQ